MQDDYSTVCGFRISKWTEFVLEKYVKADKKKENLTRIKTICSKFPVIL